MAVEDYGRGDDENAERGVRGRNKAATTARRKFAALGAALAGAARCEIVPFLQFGDSKKTPIYPRARKRVLTLFGEVG